MWSSRSSLQSSSYTHKLRNAKIARQSALKTPYRDIYDTYKSKNEGKTVSKGAIHSVAASCFTLYPPVRLKKVLKRRPVNHEVLRREVDKPHRVSAVISNLKPKVARIF